jgi:biopolymer transport protein TolQ
LQEQLATSPIDLVFQSTPATKVILLVLAAFSIVSWVLIFWKWKDFHRVRKEGDEFVEAMESCVGLEQVYDTLMHQSVTPYTRVFRQGVNFFTELRPTALREPPQATEGLTESQLSTLRLVLEKGLVEERDDLGHGLTWLAIIGSVSPLLGLMGTVVGVMNSFIGITAQGTANIAAVAPGIAEALITTVVGLAVAIPAVIAFNHYAAKLGLFTSELDGFASEFIGTLAREGRV